MDFHYKTPVSILQEICVQKKWTPEYDLVVNGVGSCKPIFGFELNCNQFQARGEGKSKKEAKQNVAAKMLMLLKMDPTCSSIYIPNYTKLVESSSQKSSQVESARGNAVGRLDDFCYNYGLVVPKYDTIRQEGPAHAKSFTISCTIFDMVKEAVASTKKNGKQAAAFEMLTLLNSIVDYELNCRNLVNTDDEEFIDLSRNLPPNKPNLALNIHDINICSVANVTHSNILQALTCEKNIEIKINTVESEINKPAEIEATEKFSEVKINESVESEIDKPAEIEIDRSSPLKLFKNIASDMHFNYRIKLMGETKENQIVVISIECVPELSFIGIGPTADKASENAAENFIKDISEHYKLGCLPPVICRPVYY